MKKFNIFALIALSLAVAGNVGAAPGGASSTTPQGKTMIKNIKALAQGFTGSTNTVSKNQASVIKDALKPTTNAVAQTIAASKMPITASQAVSSKTSANAVSKIDVAGFTQGAQINNTADSAVQGGTNVLGAVRAASSNNVVSNYSGANLANLAKALTGTAASGKAQKGIISQGISGAMTMLDSDTTNKGGINITGGKTAAGNIANGVGGLGNLTNKTNLMTTGASNSTGDVFGSQNSTQFVGSEYNPNT